jgi:PKD repeat protein
VEVGAGAVPVAAFVFSPLEPVVGDTVFFNAATSVAGPGHQIVSYRWDWGDGQPSQGGLTRSHVFGGSASPKTGNFVVVLTVTDEAGQTAVFSQTVPVSP